jgi:osmotically-inducible protein OsmY
VSLPVKSARDDATIRRVTRTVLALLTITALALGGCTTYHDLHDCGWRGCPGDEQLTRAVEVQLAQHAELRAPNQVSVQTLKRVVYLTGQVSTDLQRQIAQSVARQVPGVRQVVNNIALPYEGR